MASQKAREAGRRLYQTHCVLCHGERGDGHGLRQASFSRPPRDLTDVAWRRATPPEQIFKAIREGVRGTAMPAWSVLGDDAVADLTVYVLSLGSAPGHAGNARPGSDPR